MKVVNYCNTGTEAVQAVLRLARGATGKTKFIKFEGHYHGWMDNVFLSFHPDTNEDYGTRDHPKPVLHGYCEGQPRNVLDNVITMPWNNLDYVKKAFKQHRGEIACILTEPIMSNCGVIMPREGYLEGLKAVCKENDSLLIFDETITGLRVALGGAQELLGVEPDITCGFKALGGGFPIFAYGASAEIMRIVSERKAVQAGTFCGNAIGCKAGITVINELKQNNGEILGRLNEIGKHMAKEIGKSASRHGETVRIQGVGGIFCVSFMEHEIYDMRDAFRETNERYFIFRRLLLNKGVHIFPTEKGLWYISAAHTDEDIEKTLHIVDQVFAEMKNV